MLLFQVGKKLSATRSTELPVCVTHPTRGFTQTLMSFESSTGISFQYSLGKEN